MAFQSVTDIYVIEGASPYVALGLVSVDEASEHDRFVQIDSSDPSIAGVSIDPDLGLHGVWLLAYPFFQADVSLNIINDVSAVGAMVVLTLTLGSDSTHINVHVLDSGGPDGPTDIVVTGDTIAEDAATGTLVASLSTIDLTSGDTFTYQLNDTRNFVIDGDVIRVAPGAKLDFETQPLQYLQVITTDSTSHQFVKDVTINLTNGDDPPDLFFTGTLNQDVVENTSFQVDFTFSDPNDITPSDPNYGLPIGITAMSGDTAFFELVGAPVGSGTGPFNFSLVFHPQDFETPLDDNHDNIYDFLISVSDGIRTTTKTFHFTVTDALTETINGTINADLLIGSDADEFIFGLASNDIINGMGGDDTLTGGMGKDFLTGGLGADIFDFDLKIESVKGANRDVIMDFHRAELDHIDLSDIDAKSKTKIVNDHFKFIGAKPFHHKAGELHYIMKAHFLLVEGDTNGDGKADFQIEVHGITKLGALDFHL